MFASQNSHLQGGGRKGLPKSFMNRFITIFIEETNERKKFSSAGASWEFNLRDLTRWCELVRKESFKSEGRTVYQPELFIDLIYIDRFRTLADRAAAIEIFELHFQTSCLQQPGGFQLTKSHLQVGASVFCGAKHT